MAREETRVGLDYLETVTGLLQRVRSTHPTAGLYESADLQWWWRNPRSTDEIPQLFWFDNGGNPEAAAILVDWGGELALVPITMPAAADDRVAHVLKRGLAHAGDSGFETVTLEIDRSNVHLLRLLTALGFTTEEGLVETWLTAANRPPVSPLLEGYHLNTRSATVGRPHHMISEKRGHGDPEPRLRETSLYRPDLDLVILDESGDTAAYGLFWVDPVTRTGLVEPMRTEDEHQRRGLARHILTTGVGLLFEAGADRIKICFEIDNPASRDLYLGVGFVPDRETVIATGPTRWVTRSG